MALVLLVVVWLCWGFSYPATAVALGSFDVLSCRLFVQILGGGALLVYALLWRRRLAIPREAWPDLLIAAVLNMTVMPLAMNMAVYLVGPGRTSVLVYTMPIWAGLFGRIFLGEALTANRLAALALGAAAVVVLISHDLGHFARAPAGVGCAILAAMSYGLGTVWLKRRDWRADPSVVAFWQLALGTVPILGLWAALRFPPDLVRVRPAAWAALAFIGLAGNGLAYFAWFRIVRRLPATTSGIGVLAIPCIGLASSAWFLGEKIRPQDLAAVALIGAALVLVLAEQLWRRPRPAARLAARRRP